MLIAKFIVKLVELVTDVVVGILGLRILLKLLGASTASPFVMWIYDTTKPILAPFQGMFPSSEIAPRLTLEFSTLFAIVAYMFVGYLLTEVVETLDTRSRVDKK